MRNTFHRVCSTNLRNCRAAAAIRAPFNESAFREAHAALELRWTADTETVYPAVPPPNADVLAAVTTLLAEWAPASATSGNALDAFIAHPDMNVLPPSPAGVSWVRLGSDMAAVGEDCPFISEPPARSLAACEAACLAQAECSLINWAVTSMWCVLRRCADPLHAALTPSPGYDAFALNRTHSTLVAISAVVRDPGAMAVVCRADPLCGGFDSSGGVYGGNVTLERVSGGVAWVRKGEAAA